MSSGGKVFHALLRRKSAQFAEAFIESNNLLVLFDNQKRLCVDDAIYCISDLSNVK